jgi:hypothetical protein
MEYRETRIQRKEDVMAKRRPKASTLKLSSIPGLMLMMWLRITSPLKMAGAMEMMTANWSMAATMVQVSRRLGRFRNRRISRAPIPGHPRAMMGLMDSTIPVMARPPIQN